MNYLYFLLSFYHTCQLKLICLNEYYCGTLPISLSFRKKLGSFVKYKPLKLIEHMFLIRHFLGEDLGTLGVKELQKLEKQLDKTLSLSRQRKVHMCMHINFPTAHALVA